jgi:hypothetical protein
VVLMCCSGSYFYNNLLLGVKGLLEGSGGGGVN